MFAKRTTIVVGAGASKEAGLPTGQDLKDLIAKSLNIKFDWREQKSGDHKISEALRLHVRKSDTPGTDINPHLHAARHIFEAMPQALSIDNFIDTHRRDDKIELCGKLAIVRSILAAESRSELYVDEQKRERRHPEFRNLQDTWYTSFFQLLTENCRLEDLVERARSITLIIFNYDRCVEHFLYHALQNYYKASPQEAAEIVQTIEIHHPYGKVGFLPWQQRSAAVEFGADPSPQQLLDLASQIKTFTEGTDPFSSEIASIRTSMLQASIVVFLGFAFHRLNMRLIAPGEAERGQRKKLICYATAKGISKSDCENLVAEINGAFGDPENKLNIRNDLTCHGLFQEYWRGLSLSV